MYSELKTDCGITKALEIIGAKWTLLIIRDLMDQPHRFSELENSLEGISPRTLALRLKELEQAEVLERDCSGGEAHPLYRLTGKGQSLERILSQLRAWGKAKA